MFGWLRSLFRAFLSPKNRAKQNAPKVAPGADSEQAGHWYFKRDILDQLDRYMVIAGRIKKTDPEGYALYRHIGAVIPPEECGCVKFALPARWRVQKTRPSFCSVAFPDSETDKNMFRIKFAYARKISRLPFDVEPTNGTAYEVVLFYNRIEDDSYWGRFSARFYVAIDSECTITPLRQIHISNQTIRHKNGDTSNIRHKSWGFGPFMDGPNAIGMEHFKAPAERASFIFCMVAGFYEQSMSACRVYATKSGVTACFDIDVTRTPYFFKDRDDVFVGGQKKKIFHIVRTHPRTNKDGTTTYIKSHFRGVRRFQWNGYDILISMPGKHGVDVLEADFGATYCDDEDKDQFQNSVHSNVIARRIGAYQRELRQ